MASFDWAIACASASRAAKMASGSIFVPSSRAMSLSDGKRQSQRAERLLQRRVKGDIAEKLDRDFRWNPAACRRGPVAECCVSFGQKLVEGLPARNLIAVIAGKEEQVLVPLVDESVTGAEKPRKSDGAGRSAMPEKRTASLRLRRWMTSSLTGAPLTAAVREFAAVRRRAARTAPECASAACGFPGVGFSDCSISISNRAFA